MFYEIVIPSSNVLYHKLLSHLTDKIEEATENLKSNKIQNFRAAMIELGFHSILSNNSLPDNKETFHNLVDSEATLYQQCAGTETMYYFDNKKLALRFNNKDYLSFVFENRDTLYTHKINMKESKTGFIFDNRIFYYPYYLIALYYYKMKDFREASKVIEKYLVTNDDDIIHVASRLQQTEDFLTTYLPKTTNDLCFNVSYLIFKLKLKLTRTENIESLICYMFELLIEMTIKNENNNRNTGLYNNTLEIEKGNVHKFLKRIFISELLSHEKVSLILFNLKTKVIPEHSENINLNALYSVLSSYQLLKAFSHSYPRSSYNTKDTDDTNNMVSTIKNIDTSINLNVLILSLFYFNFKLFSVSSYYCTKLIQNKKYLKAILPHLAICYNQTNDINKLQNLALSTKNICGHNSHVTNFIFGIYYYCKNNVIKAGLYLDKAYRLRKESRLYIETLGHFYSHIKESEKACVCFNKLLKQSDTRYKPLIYLAKEQLDSNKYKISNDYVKQFYKGIKVNKTFNGEIIRGNIYFKLNEYPNALSNFLYCKEELKKNKQMILDLYKHSTNELKESATFAVEKNDKFNVYYNLACCYFKQENYDESMKFYTKASKYCLNKADKFDIDLGMAICSILTNDLNDAMILLNSLVVQMGQRKPMLKESFYFNVNKNNKLDSLTNLIETKQNRESNISISKPIVDVIHELDAPMNLEDYLNWLIKYVMRLQSDRIKEKLQHK